MKTTNYCGIDHGGFSTVNRNIETDIRYGVISMFEVSQVWCDESEPRYILTCPICGNETEEITDFNAVEKYTLLNDNNETIENSSTIDYVCHACEIGFDSSIDFDMLEPVSYYIDNKEYMAEQTYDDSDIFIIKSPYFTYAQFCSPCAPGACHLEHPLSEGARNDNNKCYCFGRDFFEGGKAPYPVFSVKTGKEILPEQ